MGNCIYNTFGTLTKREQISSVENETNSNSLILENHAPFPGYHGSTVPDQLEPDSLFAITKLMHKEQVVIRAIQEVKKRLSFDFDATPGYLTLQNETRNFIRFKGLKYVLVGEVLDEFKKQGIDFRKSKKVASYDTLIRVHKFFSLEQINDSIFKDCENKNLSYIKVPSLLRWSSFENMTISCKNNCDDNNFDAALASIIMNKGIVDFIRIYDKNVSMEKLEDIKKKYFDAFEKL